jgi:hypothetical protein
MMRCIYGIAECLAKDFSQRLLETNITLYRCIGKHPTLTQQEQFTECHNLFNNLISNFDQSELILGGDLNLDVLTYQSCNNVSSYINSLFASGFIQTVIKPTRCTNSSATCIDHFITNCTQSSYESLIVVSKISDHFPVTFLKDFAKQSKCNKVPCLIRNFSEQNIKNFSNQLNITNWDHITNENDPEKAFDQFSSTFKLIHKNFFALKPSRFNKNIHKKQKWMTSGLLVSRNKKLSLAKLCHTQPNDTNTTLYKLYRNTYIKLIRVSKKLYYEKSLALTVIPVT